MNHDAPPRCELRGFELAAFSAWARGGMIVQGGRLADHFRSDGVAFANRVLVEAEARGWIVRRKYEPTMEMRFWGVGGFRGRKNITEAPEDAYHVEFAWEVQLSAPLGVPPMPELTPEQVAQLAELDRHHRVAQERERLAGAVGVLEACERIVQGITPIRETKVEPRTDIARTLPARSRRG